MANSDVQNVSDCKVVGRGTLENPSGRFERIQVTPDPEVDPAESFCVKTHFLKDHTQNIIATNTSPDISFNKSINPYRGCEHGCIYCFARPTHEYLGFSCGLDFETRILVKTEAAKLLRKTLSSPSWVPEVIVMSGVTDPYQPIERKLQITRQCLTVLAEFKNPVAFITKNQLICRDIDLLSELAQVHAVRVFISVTSLDPQLAGLMEPRTSRPERRLKAIEKLSQAGIPVGVLMGPVIPGLTDHEIEPILKSAADAGASSAYYTLIRLPYGVNDIFQTWLETYYPTRKQRVLNRIREMRDGKLNNHQWGERTSGQGQYAQYIETLFGSFKKRYGLNQPDIQLSTVAFRRPNEVKQLQLF